MDSSAELRLHRVGTFMENTMKTISRIATNVILKITSHIQGLHRQLYLLLILSIVLIVVLFLYSFGVPSNTLLYVNFRNESIAEQRLEAKNSQNQSEPFILSKMKFYNDTRPFQPSADVITFLVPSYTGDPRIAYNPYPKLRDKIKEIETNFHDNHSTDIIIFHTGYPFREHFIPIFEATKRHVHFVNVDHIFYKFSPGFDPHIRDPTWSQKGKWNYHHMCYFWFKQVFELKILQPYRYMMRLDDDSRMQDGWPNIFEMMASKKAIYMANQKELDFDYILPGMSRVKNLTFDYVTKNNIIVRNPPLYADLLNRTGTVPLYWNNFEVVELQFLRRKEVLDFVRTIDESQGVFLYRWGDAPLRFLELALFVEPNQILHRQQLGLNYCHPC